MGFDFFISHSLLEEDRTRIIVARPWKLGRNPILVRTWVPDFSPHEETNKNVTTVWMQIKYSLVKYHLLEVLITIGNSVGKTVAINARNS